MALFSSFALAADPVGFTWQGKCFATAQAVEQAACDAFTGINQYGPVRCLGVSDYGSDGSGESFTVSVQIATSATGSTSKNYSFYQPVCDPTVSPTDFPWNLSVEDGSAIAVAVAGCWLFGLAWRSIRQSLGSDGEALDS